MKFTEQEMVFFHSITKGDSLLGIPLHFRVETDYDTETQKTIQGLIKKGVLESETRLSKQGMLPARALECYKESKRHLILNYLHIALLEKQDAVVIIPLKDHEYELLRLPRTAVLYLLFQKYPILCQAGRFVNSQPRMQGMDAFLQELKDSEGNLMAGEFQDGTVGKEQVYYWKKEQLCRYDLNTQMRKEVTAVQVRKELLKLLQIPEEVENYG